MNQERGLNFLLSMSRIGQNLPFNPAVLSALYGQIGEASVSPLQAIAAMIDRDQALAAKLLAFANSAYYGLQSEVSTVGRAVSIIGLKEVRTIVVALAVGSLAKGAPCHPEFSLDEHWRHHFLVAAAAKDLAGRIGGADPGTIYTAGLLHDLGKLLLAMHAPDDWKAVADFARTGSVSFAEAEERHWGLDHCVVGARVLSGWNLPASLAEPVGWHHAPGMAPQHSREADILRLADGLVNQLDGSPGPGLDMASEIDALGAPSGAILDGLARVLAEGELDRFLDAIAKAA
jgi:putative nucleotidyltransferase with HDIG domain